MTDSAGSLDRLDTRLALYGLMLLMFAFLVIAGLLVSGSRDAALETIQRKNLSLAGDIVSLQTRDLIDIDGRADISLMHELAQAVMKINPALEVYLLDATGRVLAHALERQIPGDALVDLATIRPLSMHSIAQPRLPVLAGDPARPGRQAIFSAAALGHGSTPDGYLYLVLDGTTPGVVPATDTLKLTLLGIGSVGLGLAISFIWMLSRLTRPLRQLAHSLDVDASMEAALPIVGASKEVRLLEQAIRSMQRRIRDQLKALQAQDKQRRELISNVSHDLRTPLAIARGHVESCLQDKTTANAAINTEALQQTLKQLQRLEKRIRNLFDLARLECATLPLTIEDFGLAELVQDVLDGYRLSAQARNIKIAFDPGSQPMMTIRGDIALIERMLQNLLDNAFTHTPNKGRVAIAVSCLPTDSRARITVSNSGKAIAATDLPHLFDRHWCSTELSNNVDNKGTGLGLAIVRRIAQLHRAQIHVQSEPGGETAFLVDLPLSPGQPN